MPTDIPASVLEIVQDLRDRGYELEQHNLGSMGGVFAILRLQADAPEHLDAWVRVSGDRGQYSIELRFGSMNYWAAPSTWRSYINRGGDETLTLEQQADFIKYRLPDAMRAAMLDPRISDILRDLEENYMMRYLRSLDDD